MSRSQRRAFRSLPTLALGVVLAGLGSAGVAVGADTMLTSHVSTQHQVSGAPLPVARTVTARVEPTAPTRINIPSIRVGTRIVGVGFSGSQLVPPANVHTVGWWTKSARPGDAIGRIVLVGHVSDDHDNPGAFYRLTRLHRGQRVTLTLRNGAKRTYLVTSQKQYLKGTMPSRILTDQSAVKLLLISCADRESLPGGHFHYRTNVVVTARPITSGGN